MKPISGKRLCKVLEAHGWTLMRKSSSHFVYDRPGALRSIPVPVHGNRDLPTGTQHKIMKQAGLTEADL